MTCAGRAMPARAALAAALVLAWGATATAAPSGLNTIPTVDVVPEKQWTLQVQNGNTQLSDAPTLFAQPLPALQLQSGVWTQRIEAGFDAVTPERPGDWRGVANVKLVALTESYVRPAIAIGAAQLGGGFDALYYAVVTRTLDYQAMQYQRFRAHHRNLKLHGIRLHAGILGTRGDPRAFVGSDVQLSDKALLYADWIAGHDHAATLGGVWVVNSAWSAQAALLRGNGSHRLDGLQLAGTRQFGW